MLSRELWEEAAKQRGCDETAFSRSVEPVTASYHFHRVLFIGWISLNLRDEDAPIDERTDIGEASNFFPFVLQV